MKQWIGISEFVAVAELQSFTKAAKQLGISVAQVSRNIAELEAGLAIKLLYRSTRSVSLTEEGLLYLQHCRHLVASLEEANRTLANLKATPRGQIKLTAPVFYGETRIAPLLHDFMRLYPDTELDLQLSNNKLDLVQGGFDLAIRLGTLESSSLIARKLASRTQYVVASPAYLALLDAALKGLGLVQLPDYYVGDKLQRGELVAVLNELRQPDDGIWALYPQNRHLSAKVRVLVDYLAAKLN